MNEIKNEPTGEAAAATERAGIDWAKLGWGLAILVAGILLTLDRFQVLEADDWWSYTPLILVAFGLHGLFRGRSPKERECAWWLLGIGLYLLVNLLGLGGFGWHNSWPLILLLIGFIQLVDPAKPKDRANSLLFLALGAFFLFIQRDILDRHLIWPLVIIGFGLVLTWRALAGGRRIAGGEK